MRCSRPMDEGDEGRSSRGKGRSEGEGRSENDGRSNRGRGRSEGEGRSPEGRSQEDQGRPRKHTLRDVAAEAGVSIGTASNAFNRPDLISEGLRDRVFEAASRLGYGGPPPAGPPGRPGRTGALRPHFH